MVVFQFLATDGYSVIQSIFRFSNTGFFNTLRIDRKTLYATEKSLYVNRDC